MKVLALDQSFTKSGIVVFADNKMIHFEVLKTSKEDNNFLRAWNISEHFVKIAKQYEVDAIAIEGLAFCSKGNATRDLAGLLFVVITKLKCMHGYDVNIIPPTTVKKIATGKGNSKKEKLMELLPHDIMEQFLNYGVKKTTGLADLTDAYWIGISHLKMGDIFSK